MLLWITADDYELLLITRDAWRRWLHLQTVDLQTVKSFSLGLLNAVQHFSLSSKTETHFKLVLLEGLVPRIHQGKKTTASKIKTRSL